MSKRRIWQVSLVVGALMALAGVAAATEHEDTTFNYGYDEANRLLVLNTSPFDVLDPEAACQLDEDLEDDAGTEHFVSYTSFDPIEVEDLEDVDGTTCEMQATEVTGPAGQVNHGMFLKAINSLYDGPRRGCVIRHLAQSDLGKDDQQILASDPEADPEFDPLTSPSTVEFFTALADCEKSDNGETAGLQGNGNGKGRPEWAGQKGGPNSAGKSGSAPGRDR